MTKIYQKCGRYWFILLPDYFKHSASMLYVHYIQRFGANQSNEHYA